MKISTLCLPLLYHLVACLSPGRVFCAASGPDSRPKAVNYTLMRGKRIDSILYVSESGHMYTTKGNLYLK